MKEDCEKEKDNEWFNEIIRETEHYYQGEIHQDERASWILATSGVLLTIYISSVYFLIENKISISAASVLAPIIFFLLSAISAVISLLPSHSIKANLKILSTCWKKPENSNTAKLFCEQKFHISGKWDESSLERRLYYHYINHYERNLQKSKKMILSAIFLVCGFLSGFILAAIAILGNLQ